MSELKRILVPVDFSDASRDAATYADAWAGRFDGSIALLHVVPPFQFDFSMAELPGPPVLNRQRSTTPNGTVKSRRFISYCKPLIRLMPSKLKVRVG